MSARTNLAQIGTWFKKKPDPNAPSDLGDKIKTISTALNHMRRDRENFMKQVQDFVAAEQVSLNAIGTAFTGIVSGIATLDSMIVALQNSPGALTQEDQDALNAIQATSAALVAQSSAALTAVVPPPPPASAAPSGAPVRPAGV
jgi:hypothetical protein